MRRSSILNGEPVGEFNLRIPLTEEDIQQNESKFVANMRLITKEQRILDHAKAVFKEKTMKQVNENKELLKMIDDGFIEKEMKAVEIPNPEKGIFEYFKPEIDEDTGELVLLATKDMTSREKRQFRMRFSKDSLETDA